MYFLSEDIVLTSWHHCAQTTYNKFWGLLSVLKNLNNRGAIIRANTTYLVELSNISKDLHEKFHFGNVIRRESQQVNYVTFSTHWVNIVPKLFFKGDTTPHIFYVAVLAMYTEGFSSELNREELINAFLLKYKISTEIANEWFDVYNDNSQQTSFVLKNNLEDWSTTTKIAIYNALAGSFHIPPENYNLTFEPTANNYYVTAFPGELTRGPFFQTLYSSRSIQKCLLITEFDFAEYYPTVIQINEPENLTAREFPFPHNRIVYGAPGTGKSEMLNTEAASFNDRFIRVTFHPEYSSSKFIGSYKPITYYKRETGEIAYYNSSTDDEPSTSFKNEPVIDYSFVPGPFLKALVESFRSNDKFLLIIEEINRCNAASVFAEVFQLLDRENGESKYKVFLGKEAMTYLQNQVNINFTDGIYLPNNLYIWATMNSADQGVFPIDSAFKRRWSFEYLPLNKFENKIENEIISFDGRAYNWNKFRSIVNNYLSELKVPEDKLIGPFFLKAEELGNEDAIKNKLLLYLRNDVVRYKPEQLFDGNKNFFQIVEMYGRGEILNAELSQKLLSISIPTVGIEEEVPIN